MDADIALIVAAAVAGGLVISGAVLAIGTAMVPTRIARMASRWTKSEIK